MSTPKNLSLIPQAIILLVLLCGAATTAARPIPPDPTDFLHVDGRDILDSDEQPIHLRGMNMHTNYYAFTWDPEAPLRFATQEDIQFLADLGMNVIRLGLHWKYFDTSLGYDLTDDYLDWCEQAGVYVIIDMHVVPPDERFGMEGIWDDTAAQEEFLELWVDIASRYADRTIIAGYDIYNEPAPPEASQWWELADRTAAAIRSIDPHHILFVENPMHVNAGFELLDDPNVVYSLHDYTPFIVTHAGADWIGDTPVPDDYSYPGNLLTKVEWVDWSSDAVSYRDRTDDWIYWESGPLTPPEGVEFATIKLFAGGDCGDVWFDDIELLINGVPQTVYNPGAEEASPRDPEQPSNWDFYRNDDFTGTWSDEEAHSGNYSLMISAGEGFGLWLQSDWILTEPLFPIGNRDTFQVRGWLLAPDNAGGSVILGLDYLNGVYDYYDRFHLQTDIQPFLDWAALNDVPLFVGEFGAMSTPSGGSRCDLIADKTSVLNEAGLHWALWAYRDPAPSGFGLFVDSEVDESLAEVLRNSLISTEW